MKHILRTREGEESGFSIQVVSAITTRESREDRLVYIAILEDIVRSRSAISRRP